LSSRALARSLRGRRLRRRGLVGEPSKSNVLQFRGEFQRAVDEHEEALLQGLRRGTLGLGL
jgi:hypothetical protein